MMKRLLYVLVFIASLTALAHEPNKAFFTFVELENGIEVQAEFPWTLRNALIEFDPALSHATDKQAFENTFIRYIKKNLILKDSNENTLQFQSFKEVNNNGHSHQNNFLIFFKGESLVEVTNTLIFNLFQNQVNHHQVPLESETIRFKTKKGALSFRLDEPPSNEYLYFLILLVPLTMLGAGYVFKK